MVLKRRKLLKRVFCLCSVLLILFMFCVSTSASEYFDNRSYFAYPIFQSTNDPTPDLIISQTVSIGDRICFLPIFDPTNLINVGGKNARIYLPLPVIQGKQSINDARRLFLDNTQANNDNWSAVSSTWTYFSEPYFNSELVNSSSPLYSQALRIRINNSLAAYNNYRYLPEFTIKFCYIDENGDFVSGIDDKPTVAQRPDWFLASYGDSTHTYETYEIDTTVMNLTRPESAKGISVDITAAYYADDSYSVYESQPQYSQPYSAQFYFFFEDWDIQEAFSNGYAEGKKIGLSEGDDIGYERGFREGSEKFENYNAVSGLIQIAQLPSVFISSMLNFDAFGVNTAYLVKHLFTCLIVAFVTVIFVRFIL